MSVWVNSPKSPLEVVGGVNEDLQTGNQHKIGWDQTLCQPDLEIMHTNISNQKYDHSVEYHLSGHALKTMLNS